MKTLKVLLQEVVSGMKAWVNSNFAQESNAVHKTGNETITGSKEFSGSIITSNSLSRKVTGITDRNVPSSMVYTDDVVVCGNDGVYWGGLKHFWSANGDSTTILAVSNWREVNNAWSQGYWECGLIASKDFSTVSFYPSDSSINLGTSSNQWNSVYAQSYYYNGTEFQNKFATLDTYQYVTSAKGRVASAITSKTALPESEVSANLVTFQSNDHTYWGDIGYRWLTDGETQLIFSYTNWTTAGSQGWWRIAFAGNKNFSQVSFKPLNNNTIHLGTAENFWRSVSSGYFVVRSIEYELGTIPTSAHQRALEFTDKNAETIGWIKTICSTTGENSIEMLVANKFANNTLDKTGTSDYALLKLLITPSLEKNLYSKAHIRPWSSNIYNLGSSSGYWNDTYTNVLNLHGTTSIDKTQTTYSSKESQGYIHFRDGNNSWYGGIGHEYGTDGTSTLVLDNGNFRTNSSQVTVQLRLETNKAFTDSTFRPVGNGINLGNSNNKWKTLNGVNPGGLSFPDNLGTSGTENVNYFTISGLAIDGSITSYTPPCDGWLYVNAKNDDTNGDSFIIFDDYTSSFGTSVFGNKGLQNNNDGLLCLMMPVNKNNGVNIKIKSPGIVSARLYPCRGNV